MAAQNRSSKPPRGGAGTNRPAGAPPSARGGSGTRQGASSGGPRRLGQQSNAPRRLGQQPATARPSSGAQRRAQRARGSSARYGWLAVALVVVVAAVIIGVHFATSSTPKPTNTSADRNPPAVSSAVVTQLATVPAQVFNSVGVGTQPAALDVISGAPPLTSATLPGASKTGKALPVFAFVGGEFCPWCALARYSMVLALSRFGTFHGLKAINSGPTDGNIPTFSFLGSTYTSPYVKFVANEYQDRLRNPLERTPTWLDRLFFKYSAAQYCSACGGSPGIPFLDVANKYESEGAPGAFTNTESVLGGGSSQTGGGITRSEIVAGIRNPNSSIGQAIGASIFISDANYQSAAICGADGGMPHSVCNSSGVKAAAAALAATKAIPW